MIVADKEVTLVLTGNGDVLEPGSGVAAIGSGGNFALAAATALLDYEEDAETIARKAMAIAAEICVYTNGNLTVESARERELSWTVERLDWADEPLGEIELAETADALPLGLRLGPLPPGRRPARNRLGGRRPRPQHQGEDGGEALRPRPARSRCASEEGAKIMPRLDLGPAIAELRVAERPGRARAQPAHRRRAGPAGLRPAGARRAAHALRAGLRPRRRAAGPGSVRPRHRRHRRSAGRRLLGRRRVRAVAGPARCRRAGC